MELVLNLTQHQATPEQGCAERSTETAAKIKELLTFTELPEQKDIQHKAEMLATLAQLMGAKTAMIGGAPYLMGQLEDALLRRGIKPVYAYSERVSVESVNEDGSVSKSMVFKHLGFISV